MLLQQQTFLQKCEAWMDFLSQTEQKLAAEISGNYQSLLEQQRDHEVINAALVCLLLVMLLLYQVYVFYQIIISFLFPAVPSRDVQQATDSVLHHQ